MQTSVNLQPPFSYSVLIIFLFLVPILSIAIYLLIKLTKKQDIEDVIQNVQLSQETLGSIKVKYIKKIDMVENKIKDKKISIRIAYQNLSSIIRDFVHEVTNIKVQNYTLREISKLNIPILVELIR